MRPFVARALAGVARMSAPFRQIAGRGTARVSAVVDPFVVVIVGGGSVMMLAGEIGRVFLATRLGFGAFLVGVGIGCPVAFMIVRWVENSGTEGRLLLVSAGAAVVAAGATWLPTIPL